MTRELFTSEASVPDVGPFPQLRDNVGNHGEDKIAADDERAFHLGGQRPGRGAAAGLDDAAKRSRPFRGPDQDIEPLEADFLDLACKAFADHVPRPQLPELDRRRDQGADGPAVEADDNDLLSAGFLLHFLERAPVVHPAAYCCDGVREIFIAHHAMDVYHEKPGRSI